MQYARWHRKGIKVLWCSAICATIPIIWVVHGLMPSRTLIIAKAIRRLLQLAMRDMTFDKQIIDYIFTGCFWQSCIGYMSAPLNLVCILAQWLARDKKAKEVAASALHIDSSWDHWKAAHPVGILLFSIAFACIAGLEHWLNLLAGGNRGSCANLCQLFFELSQNGSCTYKGSESRMGIVLLTDYNSIWCTIGSKCWSKHRVCWRFLQSLQCVGHLVTLYQHKVLISQSPSKEIHLHVKACTSQVLCIYQKPQLDAISRRGYYRIAC